jgi:GNAT superfamily N-acetyltransferase
VKIINEITALETYIVRHPVLREGKPVESCRFEGDDLPSTKHFGLFYDEDLVAVASVFESVSPLFDDKKHMQLRGMAVLADYRGRHFGERLLKYSEAYARRKEMTVMWFNARIVAVPFYEKCGYQIIGESFDIGDIGLHFVMFKRF